jgi:hypothetical protein
VGMASHTRECKFPLPRVIDKWGAVGFELSGHNLALGHTVHPVRPTKQIVPIFQTLKLVPYKIHALMLQNLPNFAS